MNFKTALVAASLLVLSGTAQASSTSHSISESYWEGMKSLSELSEDERKAAEVTLTKLNRIIEANNERHVVVREMSNSFMLPRLVFSGADYYKYLAHAAVGALNAKLLEAQMEIIEIALRSDNKGPIARNKGESGGISGQTTKFSVSRSVSGTITTCEDNLKWKGYSINCQNGYGNGTKDGVSYEFINWVPIKAEGVEGPVRWRYQGGGFTVTHIAKGTEVTFSLDPQKGISVISADNLVSFKREGSAGLFMDVTSKNMTRHYVDLFWKEYVFRYLGLGYKDDSYEYYIPSWADPTHAFLAMQFFVRDMAEDPDNTESILKELANLDPEKQERLKNGTLRADHTRRRWRVDGQIKDFNLKDSITPKKVSKISNASGGRRR